MVSILALFGPKTAVQGIELYSGYLILEVVCKIQYISMVYWQRNHPIEAIDAIICITLGIIFLTKSAPKQQVQKLKVES